MPILSPALADYAARRLAARGPELAAAAVALPESLQGDRRTLMALLMGTLPLTDLTDRPADTLLDYVDHALTLRATMPWTRALPEDVFVHYVFWPRVNNERLEPCRERIFDDLADRVEGLDAARAVVETNTWCAEHLTYSPSDERTLGPYGTLNRGVGRCGEESTLLVHALRAIGIPARQVYTPRWAHCDDNHAWVEALVDGTWRFLGACEPEERLDRGWFDRAASRAMLVHARVFCDYTTGTVDASADAGCRGGVLLENLTASYAPTTPLEVTVRRADGSPAAGALVAFELPNGAELFPLATLAADADGRARLELGRGTVLVHASLDGDFGETIADTAACGADGTATASVTLDGRIAADATSPQAADTSATLPQGWRPMTFAAPAGGPSRAADATPEERQASAARAAGAERRRVARLARFADEALRRAEADGLTDPDVPRLLRQAGGNWPVVEAFLAAAGDEADRMLRIRLLTALSAKDLCDVSGAVLEDALGGAMAVRGFAADALAKLPEGERLGMVVDHVLDPRVAHEELAGDRRALQRMIDDTGRGLARRQPRALCALLDSYATVPSCEEVPPVAASTFLTARRGTAEEAALAFVAICRALGVPARLDPVTGQPQWFDGTAFVDARRAGSASDAPRAGLVPFALVAPDAARPPRHGVDFTLGRLGATGHGTDWTTLDLGRTPWHDGRMELTLAPGDYRLVTTVRLPDGGQLAAVRRFALGAGSPVTRMPLAFREPREDQLLERLPLEDLPLTGADGAATSLTPLAADGPAVLFVLDAHGSEPSMHVLDELIQLGADDPAALTAVRPVLALTPADAPVAEALAGMLARLPFETRPWHCDARTAERLARTSFVDPSKTPLIVALAPGDDEAGAYARYACSGYNVGSVALAVRLAAR
ncbi:transglutaminase domain-containing protein [Bifidobacterium pullorum subsp. saeculare]|uniref:Transglutaminase domain-containing protein n=1 Tax=Bifidobacterium pullorum subsp. saeculare TaxID=78257 RepID=A0A939B8Z7_9BIFI|nr:transglutaminase-like domain-containing protein [Bifidobacterium pullorum]MBM6698958.1 transglutaminase domain-containing protein [Bifidobacterium pullorum subsp. saeculare]